MSQQYPSHSYTIQRCVDYIMNMITLHVYVLQKQICTRLLVLIYNNNNNNPRHHTRSRFRYQGTNNKHMFKISTP